MGPNVNLFNKFSEIRRFSAPRLHGGGIILSYRCTNRCRHCLVAGSPGRENRWMRKAMMDEVFGTIKSLGPDCEIHIGGGEPFLNPECLAAAVSSAVKHDIALSYVETNGFWGRNPGKYLPVLRELKKIGLKCILISVSPFHAEFVSPETTEAAIGHIREVFGYAGAFVWVPEFFEMLGRHDKRRPLKFSEIPPETLRRIPDKYYLVPGGRVGFNDPPMYALRPAKDHFMTECSRELNGTAHFHIDCYGYYMPGGLCAGIAPCTFGELAEGTSLDDKPVMKALLNGGVKYLFEYASSLGFVENRRGYAGKCHLCVELRKFIKSKAGCPELAPDEFYSFL